jgi:hypothetical protein
MAWYLDLSPYEYFGDSPPMLNVGWLERGRDFDTGPVPPEFTVRLREMSQRPTNLCRGVHDCDLCDPLDDAPPVDFKRFQEWLKEPRAGNGEIHVRSADGKVYSAPALIVHYVEAHHYRPPKEFVDAVMSGGHNAPNTRVVDGL